MQNEPRDGDNLSNIISVNGTDAKNHHPAPWSKTAASLSLVLLGSGMTLAGGYLAGHHQQLSQNASNLAVTPAIAAPPIPAGTDPNLLQELWKG